MSAKPRMPRRRWMVLVAAMLGVALTVRLGLWQLSRAAQKEAIQASIEQRGAMPPLHTGDLAHDAGAAEAQHYRRIVLHGRWRPQASVFLDNRQMNGHPGFDLLTPLELAPGDAVVVQRGWAPRDPMDRAHLPQVPTPAGEVEVIGMVAPPPAALFDFGGDASGPLRQNVDLAAYARETGLALRPLSIQQQGGTGTANDGLLRQWPAPAANVQMHYGYAFQWFALAALLTGLYVWFQLIDPWRRARR